MKGSCTMFLVFLVGLALIMSPCAWAGERDELLQELRLLRKRVEQLETKIKKFEEERAEVQEDKKKVEGQEEKGSAKEEEEKKLRKEIAAIWKVLKGIEIEFSATGVVQGSVGNHKNSGLPSDRERADRVDGFL